MPALYIVATPIGNLSDISPRALDTLRAVGLIAAEDTRVTQNLLRHFEMQKPLLSYHKFNEAKQAEHIIAGLLEKGIDAALVSDAGTPCISDPGSYLVQAALEARLPVIPIPGPSAAVSALSASGLPADSFLFLGFLPRQAKKRAALLAAHRATQADCAIFYESPLRIADTLGDIEKAWGDRPAAAFRELTKLHETHYRGNLSGIRAAIQADPNGQRGEYTLVCALPREAAEEAPAGDCPEADIVRVMVENGLPLRDAAAVLIEGGAKRNKIYAAKLRLQEILEDMD